MERSVRSRSLFAVLLVLACAPPPPPGGGGGGDDPIDDPPPVEPPPVDDPGDVLVAPGRCGDVDARSETAAPNPIAGFDANADTGTFALVYVRYPLTTANVEDPAVARFVAIPQGEDAYNIAPGASLMLRQPDGEERVLVDCADANCSVMDPSISFDGQFVYYSRLEDARTRATASFIFKMKIAGDDPLFQPIRLTFDDGFESRRYAGNDSDAADLGTFAGVRDMAPVQLTDGRIAFLSNRAGLIAFHPEIFTDVSQPAVHSALQQLFVVDDHDGNLNTSELSNLQRIDFSNLHLAQHPVVLKDGRLMFSSWHDAATKDIYSMTSLFSMNPDGTGYAQVTEPHDRNTEIDHFATQLPDDDVVTGFYYPSFDYGFGVLARFPIAPGVPAFTFGHSEQCYPYNGFDVSARHFERVGLEIITTHTFPDDSPAPGSSGKYSMPSVAPGGALLTAYSTGDVNFFESHNGFAPLASGVYLIDNPSKELNAPVDGEKGNGCDRGPACEDDGDCDSGFTCEDFEDPEIPRACLRPTGAPVEKPSDLTQIVDDERFNEIWPRAVASYRRMYGVDRPIHRVSVPETAPEDDRLDPSLPVALMGTSSMLTRETHNNAEVESKGALPFDSFRGQRGAERPQGDGNWGVYGAEAGVMDDDDIQAVRVVMIVPRPFTKLIDAESEDTADDFDAIRRYLRDQNHGGIDQRLTSVVERYASGMGERWEILGEFPVRKPGTNDPAGDVDTSWLARVPADTPMIIQSLDSRGMTVVSELTWRALRPGEKRADCGGCHAHSIAPVDFASTAAGRREPVDYATAAGVNAADDVVAGGVWDLVSHRPLLRPGAAGSLSVEDNGGAPLDVEFYRDVQPILQARCVACHSAGADPGGGLVLNGSGDDDAYARLTENFVVGDALMFEAPQLSKYIRVPQARQSLLVWVAYNERLDGRTNAARDDDVDLPVHPEIPGLTDEERLRIARWVDLGSPVDFPSETGFRYQDDNLLPVIQISTPRRGENLTACNQLRFGVIDVESGVDRSSVAAEWYLASDATRTLTAIPIGAQNGDGVYTAELGDVPRDTFVVLRVSASDVDGNTQVSSRRVLLRSD